MKLRGLNNNMNSMESLKGLKVEDYRADAKELVLRHIANDCVTKKEFLSIDKLVVADCVNDPFGVMGLSFVAESKVGLWTNKAMKICTAMPESLKDKFEEAFPHGGERMVSGRHYRRIFIGGINCLKAIVDDDSHIYEVETNYVSNNEINIFDRRIKQLDVESLTVEDVKDIQKDLWHLFRAWQESAIDMTKDKRKVFNKSMDDVLGSIQVLSDLGADEYSDNIRSVLKSIETAVFSEDKAAEAERFEIELNMEAIDEDLYVETTLGNFREEMGKTIVDFFNEYAIPHLKDCNGEIWLSIADEYRDANQDELHLAYIISKTFTILSELNVGKVLPSYYTIVRDGIYTWASVLDINEEDVIGLAILQAIYGVGYKDGEYVLYDNKVRENVKIYMLEKVFGDILTARVIGDEDGYRSMVYDIDVKQLKNVYIDICNGDTFTVRDSIAYNQDNSRAFDLYSEKYNGGIIMAFDNRLVEVVDVYDEAEINNELPMTITDSQYIHIKENGKWKWKATNDNRNSIKELSGSGEFLFMVNKSGKVMLTKDRKTILSTIDPAVTPISEGEEAYENVFFLGYDSSEAWDIDGKEVEKTGNLLLFDVKPDDYFSSKDIEVINSFLKVEDRQEQANKDLGVIDDDDEYETSF